MYDVVRARFSHEHDQILNDKSSISIFFFFKFFFFNRVVLTIVTDEKPSFNTAIDLILLKIST